MPDYQKMYTTLFNKITDIIEELQEVQQLTEELYLQSCDEECSSSASPLRNSHAKSPKIL